MIWAMCHGTDVLAIVITCTVKSHYCTSLNIIIFTVDKKAMILYTCHTQVISGRVRYSLWRRCSWEASRGAPHPEPRGRGSYQLRPMFVIQMCPWCSTEYSWLWDTVGSVYASVSITIITHAIHHWYIGVYLLRLVLDNLPVLIIKCVMAVLWYGILYS